MSEYIRKYATATHVYITMVKRGVVDHAVSADWTPAAGDVKLIIDGAAAANVGTLPVAIASGNGAVWDFVFTTGEMTGKKIRVEIADSATKAVEDNGFDVITYGNASAEIIQDISASVAQTGDNYALANGASGFVAIKGVLPSALTANGNIKASLVEILTTALTETAGQIAGGFKKFFNIATPAATMDHGVLVDTVTTTTNTTNTPTVGDFNATQKTSLNAATPVASLSGDLTSTMKTSVTTAATAATPIAASVTGAVGSVTAPVTITGDLSATMKTSVTTAATAATPTVAAVTGDTKQTADVATLIATVGAAGAGLTGAGPSAAGIRTALGLASANVDTQLGAINSKTTNLPASPADESLIIAATNALGTSIGALPTTTTVNAIKAKTDLMPSAAAISAQVAADAITTPLPSNIKKVNDVTVNGAGATGNSWGP